MTHEPQILIGRKQKRVRSKEQDRVLAILIDQEQLGLLSADQVDRLIRLIKPNRAKK